MARGFESKQVESQQADREAAQKPAGVRLTPDEAARASRRRTLEMARARAVQDLQTAHVPAHRSMLETAIESLDAQIADIAKS